MRAVTCALLLLFGIGVVALNFPDAESQGTHSLAAQVLAAPAKEDRLALWPIEKVRLVKMTWSLERDAALVTVWLENKNDFPVRDVMIECDFNAENAFRLHRKRETLITIFPAKKTTRITKINFGYINSQVRGADCLAIDAVHAEMTD